MYNWPLLSLIIFLPLVGAFFILLIRGDEVVVARNSKYLALWTTLINFIISLLLWFQFDTSTSDFQFVEQLAWLSEDITYHLGIDGISMLFIILSTFLMPICILASWNSINTRVREYMVAFLVMETAMVGVFSSLERISASNPSSLKSCTMNAALSSDLSRFQRRRRVVFPEPRKPHSAIIGVLFICFYFKSKCHKLLPS